MSLKAIHLKHVYHPQGNSTTVVDEFLEPVLAKSVIYKRVTGYFSSSVLADAAAGIAGILDNRGKIQLVTSHSFTPSDSKTVDDFHSSDAFANELVKSFDETIAHSGSLNDALRLDHLRGLCWLLANNYLEIKIVVPKTSFPEYDHWADVEKFHPKFGLASDSEGNTVAFSGSVNETASGWTKNLENLSVYRSWIEGQREYVDEWESQFERYWNNTDLGDWVVLSLPNAVKKHMIESTGAEDFPKSLRKHHTDTLETLRDYQLDAVRAWNKNGKLGILAMATGSGKTRTAKRCLEEALKEGTLATVVVAPYQHIAEQWFEELREFEPVLATGSTNWRESLRDLNLQLQLGHRESFVVISVKNTASSTAFIQEFTKLAKNSENCLFIGDEVHWLGAPKFQAALIPEANFRLGLSATPKRYFDESGTNELFSYFDKEVFEFTLRKALDEGILCRYDYYPVFVTLTEEEAKEYKELSKQLAVKLSMESTAKIQQEIELLRLLRANIGKSASNKIPAFASLYNRISTQIDFTLIYCADNNQMSEIAEILQASGLFFQKVTGQESTAKTKKLGGQSPRSKILNDFANGTVDVLLAIDCLDEGVDIPAARQGVILASSGNPKEFIQRRGRLMRQSPGKEKAVIFDFVVVPDDELLNDFDRLQESELERVAQFALDADNKEEVLNAIAKYRKDTNG